MEIVEAIVAVLLGVLTVIQLNSRTKLRKAETVAVKVEATAENAKAEAEKARAEAEKARAEAEQTRSSAMTIQTLTGTLTKTIEEATEERRRAEKERLEHIELQRQFVEAMLGNTRALQNHSVVMADVDARLGVYAEEHKKDMAQIISVGRALETRLENASAGLESATTQLNRLPADVEAKLQPILDHLNDVIEIVKTASGNVNNAADAIQRVRLGFNEDLEALKQALLQAFRGETHETPESI